MENTFILGFIVEGMVLIHYNFADFFQRMDLSTGEIVDIVSPSRYPWIVYTFSPDETKFIFIPGSGPELEVILHDLDTHAEEKISLATLSGFSPGDIIWSPDGTKIAFGVLAKRGDNHKVEVFVVDLVKITGESIVLIDHSRPYLVEWVSDSQIWIDIENKFEILDIQTGELTPATPQP